MSEFRTVTHSEARTDAWGKVTGETQFVDDLPLESPLHGAVVRSPHHHARIVRINTEAAKRLDGVVAVLDWEIAHIGDPMRDLGWICTNSWRFGRADLPVGGVGSYEDLFAGYESVSGEPVENPETVATAIRIGNPASWDGAVAARDESGGIIAAVTDDEILAAYRLVASREGVFGEPACAAPIAGVLKHRDELPDGPVVITMTGHGLFFLLAGSVPKAGWEYTSSTKPGFSRTYQILETAANRPLP